MSGQGGFLELHARHAGGGASGNPLERLTRALKWPERRKGGRPPMDAVTIADVLVLRALCGLSGERGGCQVREGHSSRRFWAGSIRPGADSSAVWQVREALEQAWPMEAPLTRLDAQLMARGYVAPGGSPLPRCSRRPCRA
ncbi:hypothetical protein SH611_17635 [Geminicoccaceae bacterium 1502E]|nr:hypothetical protein [Geminicoccaceae bacterium 1502E]